MDRFLDKASRSVKTSAYKISMRTNSAWNRVKLNKQIIKLRADMSKGLKKLGRRYYEMWAAENINFDEIDSICQSILDKEDKINGIKLEIRELAQKEKDKMESRASSSEKPVTHNVVNRETDSDEGLPVGNGPRPVQADAPSGPASVDTSHTQAEETNPE